MKKYSLILAAIWITISVANATVHRINNVDESADFQSIQAAIDDNITVSDGDTLLVEGSSFLYNGFTCDRLLYIIGPGFRLAENPRAGATTSYAVINTSAEFAAGAEGSVFSGFVFDDDQSTDAVLINGVDNITIMRCFHTRPIDVNSTVNSALITQNYFDRDPIDTDQSSDLFQAIVFENNIVASDFDISTSTSSPRTFASVENNLFLADIRVTAGTFRNNIWFPLESSTVNVTAGTEEHNLFFNAVLGTENGNQGFTDGTDVFGDRTGRSFDQQWELTDDSEFKGSGHDGTDPGPFGGSNPYILSGVPPLPVIYEIDAPGFGNQETGLPVTIKVRSSN